MRLAIVALICGLALVLPGTLWAQSQISEFIRRLDRNRDGFIDPSEISDREQSYLERFAESSGIRLGSRVSVGLMEAAAREYFERRRSPDGRSDNRGSNSVAAPVSPVDGFGLQEGLPIVPGFSPEEIRWAYTLEDIRDAESRLRRYDENRDGFIDREEAREARWGDRDPFIYDFDEDGRLSKHELTQRYAKRRLDDVDDDDDRGSSSQRGDTGMFNRDGQPDERRDDERRDDDRRNDDRDRRESGDGPGRADYYLAIGVIGRYDTDRNGRLDRDRREWDGLGSSAADADANRDGSISRDELAAWLAVETKKQTAAMPPDPLAAELPEWFFDRDFNRDGQISMAEFAEEWSDEKAEEFLATDADNDGFITRIELVTAQEMTAGTYTDNKAQVLLPRTTLIGEIEIEEDYLIGDLDVQLSITHTSVEQLDAYLIGPDGQRVELFTGVGGNDDHFDATIFDDEAESSITRGRPPFQGRFRPEAVDAEQPSLRHFYGHSVQGLWQLMIRTTRSDRSGLLHNWSLIVKRQSSDPPDYAE
jgi:Ca2+-binding EF-hand superfamily protein